MAPIDSHAIRRNCVGDLLDDGGPVSLRRARTKKLQDYYCIRLIMKVNKYHERLPGSLNAQSALDVEDVVRKDARAMYTCIVSKKVF
jgi:hypothetical protein